MIKDVAALREILQEAARRGFPCTDVYLDNDDSNSIVDWLSQNLGMSLDTWEVKILIDGALVHFYATDSTYLSCRIGSKVLVGPPETGGGL